MSGTDAAADRALMQQAPGCAREAEAAGEVPVGADRRRRRRRDRARRQRADRPQ
jgi:hypothetical protein